MKQKEFSIPLANLSGRRCIEITQENLNSDPTYTRYVSPTGTVTNVTYQLVWYDSGGSLVGTVSNAIRLAADDGVVGIVGEYSSARTQPMALALNSFGVFNCAPSTNPDFSNKAQYRFFFRTVPSDKAQGLSLVRFVQSFGWNKVALITVNAAYGYGLSSAFLEYANAQNVTVLRNEAYNPDDPNFRSQITSIRQTDARIVIIIGYDTDAVNVLREARLQGLVGPKYVWIGVSAVGSLFDLVNGKHKPFGFKGETRSKYTDQDRENIDGMIFSSINEKGGQGWTSLNTKYQAKYGALPSAYSYMYSDCLTSYAVGFKNLVEKSGFGIGQILNRSTGVNAGVFTSLVGFDGASGNVSYDANGDRKVGFLYKNVQKNKVVETFLSDFDGRSTLVSPILFFGGSSTPPLDSLVRTRDVLEAWSPFSVFIVTFNMLGATLVILSAVLLIVYRASPLVHNMSLSFLLLTSCGLVVGYFAVFGWIGHFEINLACEVQQWIFDNKQFDKTVRYLRDVYLLPMSIPITAINVIIIATWTHLDPLKPKMVITDNGASYHYECQSSSSYVQDTFNITLLTYNGFLILTASVLAYLTRNATGSYNETTFILYASQNILICAFVVTLLVYTSGGSFMALSYLRLVLMWVSTTAAFFMTVGRTAMMVLYEAINSGMLTHSFSASSKGGEVSSEGRTQSCAQQVLKTQNFPIVLPVKDGTRTFSKWMNKRINFIESYKIIHIMNPDASWGDFCRVGSQCITITKSSMYPNCVDLKYGAKFLILQMEDAESTDVFLTYFEPIVSSYIKGPGV
ncbi:hypothetical protein HDU97_001258 [Phlyctochytrium planicorne]|nr:hypothetical protein HDU97_001258 [Phlyctochytrium planicorne]